MEEICTASLTFRSACFELATSAARGHPHAKDGGENERTRIAVTDRQVSTVRYERQVSKNKHISRHSLASIRASITANTQLAAKKTASTADGKRGGSSEGRVPSGRLVAKMVATVAICAAVLTFPKRPTWTTSRAPRADIHSRRGEMKTLWSKNNAVTVGALARQAARQSTAAPRTSATGPQTGVGTRPEASRRRAIARDIGSGSRFFV